MKGRTTRIYNEFTEDLYDLFLETLAETGAYIKACEAVNINYTENSRWRSENPEFQILCTEAMAVYRQKFIDAAEARAVRGVDVPIIGGRNRDKVVAHEKRYSDRLLELFLKRSDNGAFTDKQEISHTGSMDIRAEMDLGSLSKKARRMLRALIEQINIDKANRALGRPVDQEEGSDE